MRSRLTDAVLVIVDISGYTRFVHDRAVSLEHAEAIVTELIESIIDHTDHPLVVNKLEGDAALLYAETQWDRPQAVASAFRQVAGFFAAFAVRLERIRDTRSHCHCDACANIGSLRLKAFVHAGEIVVKRVGTFEEIAGEPVILVHRITKNDVPAHEYLLLTDVVRADAGELVAGMKSLAQSIDGVMTTLHWCDVDAFTHAVPPQPRVAVPAGAPASAIARTRAFAHLPVAEGTAQVKQDGWLPGWLRRVLRLR